MVLYHGTDSSSKRRKVNLHNLSIRCKALGLQEDSGDQYFAAGIDRTLNGGLTQCANSGNIFHSSSIILLRICFKVTANSFRRLKFFAEDWGHKWRVF